jgi:hypothetical protein
MKKNPIFSSKFFEKLLCRRGWGTNFILYFLFQECGLKHLIGNELSIVSE